jgi:predicted ATPase
MEAAISPADPVYAPPAAKTARMPVQHTVDVRVPFVGRQRELGELAELLQPGRALTLVGPGGVGKSRLALETAIGWERHQGRSFFVPLAGVEASTVAGAVCAALGLREEAGRAALDTIAEAVFETEVLILMDNCEDAISDVAAVAQRLSALPQVTVLATSRSRLGTPEETVVEVRPFDAHDGGEFLAARAQLAHVEIDPHRKDASAVRSIVSSLDGLAVAIDLAAARLVSLTVEELAEELAHPRPYHFRSSGSSEPRHWTLNRVVDWSLSKLDAEAQRAFALAGRFTNPFSAQDVAALMDAPAALTSELLGRLAAQSLIVRTDATGEFSMLSPVRAVAMRRLARLVDRRAIDERFAVCMNAFATSVRKDLEEADWLGLIRVLTRRYDDLTGALGWAAKLSEERLPLVVAIYSTLVALWADGGRFAEGLQMTDRILEGARSLDGGDRGRFYYGATRIAFAAREYDRMLALGPQMITTFTIAGDRIGLARAYNALGVASMHTGRFEEASTYVDTAFALYEAIGHDPGISAALMNQGIVALEGRADPVKATEYFERSLEIATRGSSNSLAINAYGNLAEAAYVRHDPAAIERYANLALERLADTGDAARSSWQHNLLARARLLRGDVGGAARELVQSLSLLEKQVHPEYLATSVVIAARVMATERHFKEAALLVLAAARYRRERRVPAIGTALLEARSETARIKRGLAEGELREAAQRARALDLRRLATTTRQTLLEALPS